MSVWASITIVGTELIGDSYDVVESYLSKFGGTLDMNGSVQGMTFVDGDADFHSEPLNSRDPIELARTLVKSGRLSTLNYGLELDGEIRYFEIDARGHDRLVVRVIGNRVVLEDRFTDFSWYYVNVVPRFSIAVNDMGAVEFSDWL